MKFINSILTEKETVLKEIKFHWNVKAIIILCFMLSFLIIPFFIALSLYIKLISTEQAITDKRIIVKKGFISRKTDEIILSKIETIEINQTFLGRIFGFGSIKVTGVGNSVFLFENIDSPLEIKKILENKVFN